MGDVLWRARLQVWVELSDSWISDVMTQSVCNELGLPDTFLFSDTPQQVCGQLAAAACGDMFMGSNIREAQFKRECIHLKQSKELIHSKQRTWILSTEQDTSIHRRLLHDYLDMFRIPSFPCYHHMSTRKHKISTAASFFLANDAFYRFLYENGTRYVACKRAYYACGAPCARVGQYTQHMYNNDHLISHCIDMYNIPVCLNKLADATGRPLVIDYNAKRTRRSTSLNSTRNMLAFHHTGGAYVDWKTDGARLSGLRLLMKW